MKVAQLRSLDLNETSPTAVIRESDGAALRIDHYDTLIVHEKNEPRALWRRPKHEFVAPASVELTEGELRVRDFAHERTFPVNQVEEVELSAYAPDRALLILGISLVVPTLIAALAASSIEEPESDVDNRGRQYVAAAGIAALTFGVGLAITIPATSGLGHRDAPAGEGREPRKPRFSNEYRDLQRRGRVP